MNVDTSKTNATVNTRRIRVFAVQNIRYIIHFLQGQRIENFDFKHGITSHSFGFLLQIYKHRLQIYIFVYINLN